MRPTHTRASEQGLKHAGKQDCMFVLPQQSGLCWLNASSRVDVVLLEVSLCGLSKDPQCECATSPRGHILQGGRGPVHAVCQLGSVLAWKLKSLKSMISKEASSEVVWNVPLALDTRSTLW